MVADGYSWIPQPIQSSSRSFVGSIKHTVRKELEDAILLTIAQSPNDKYSILYGAKGAGKSELMQHLANDESRKAVVIVNVNSAETRTRYYARSCWRCSTRNQVQVGYFFMTASQR